MLFSIPNPLLPTLYPPIFERTNYGISAASGLPELWIARWNDGGLDYSRHGIDQQLLQAAGPECHPVHGAASSDERSTDGAAELSSAVATGDGYDAVGEH
jgi:hypothetical protein